jgi:hypothetical protein
MKTYGFEEKAQSAYASHNLDDAEDDVGKLVRENGSNQGEEEACCDYPLPDGGYGKRRVGRSSGRVSQRTRSFKLSLSYLDSSILEQKKGMREYKKARPCVTASTR